MRINQYVAQASGLSRRAADTAIQEGRVLLNGRMAKLGEDVDLKDSVLLDGQVLKLTKETQTILLNKPVGYVVSRNGQGSPTVYELLPDSLALLKPIGRLDKDSSGLLLLTSSGQLAQELSHPSKEKQKHYLVRLDKSLEPQHKTMIETGVQLEDGISRLRLIGEGVSWEVSMHEGRNRQVRRTFASLGYQVVQLHRVSFGDYNLGQTESGAWTYV